MPLKPSISAKAQPKLAVALSFFALGHFAVYYLIIPLWAWQLGASPFLIGLAVGVRPLAPAILSIHAGAMMDRIGVRKTLIATAIPGVLVPLAIPLFPSIWMLIVLQIVGGLSEGLGWLGAQTRLAQVARGDTRIAGWFSLAGKTGTLMTPIIAGFLWDTSGAVSAFVFAGLWASGFLVVVLLLPIGDKATTRAIKPRELFPQISDYRSALRLFAIPVVSVVMLATFLRLGAFGIQGSFYPVWLKLTGLGSTTIGFLIGIASLAGAASSMLAAPACQRAAPVFVLLISVVLAILGMALTPLATSLMGWVMLAMLFGVGVGINLPVMLSVLSQVTSPETQGLSAGLRATINRVGNIVVPIVMGLIVEVVGLQMSFPIIGVILMSGLLFAFWIAKKHRLLK